MPQSLHTGQTPSVTDASDGTPGITAAVSLLFGVPGQITHVGFYATTTTGGTYTGAVWQVTNDDVGAGGTGTLLESKVYAGSVTPGAFNWIPLDDPVVITPDTVLYRCGVHNNQGRYVATNSVFASPLVNDDITAPANGDDAVGFGAQAQGTFIIDAALTYPRQVGTSADYFADVIFVPDDEEPETEPVTPKSWAMPFDVLAAVTPKSWAMPFDVLTAVTPKSWAMPFDVYAAVSKSWELPFDVYARVTKSWALPFTVEGDELGGLAGAREEIRQALATVAGVNAFAERPAVIGVGAGWPAWRGLTRSHGTTGLMISTWDAYVAVGKTEQAATDYVDQRANTLAEALQPAGWITGIAPYLIATDQGNIYAVHITLTRE